ncbi:MAG: right-handed parallel beta-helix repeat-containing protein [Gammaproteobacteria bacterium]|nr:right-handed parallel beta-helix repeat-containing protein [Gammaproteobacteria bacterium]
MIQFIRSISILFMFAFSAQAADYHVCSNGSNSNDGLSHNSAWKTYAKAISMIGSLNGGDSILFCKGETFAANGSRRVVNKNSRADNRIRISSYTPPNAPIDISNPTIYASGGGHAFAFEDDANADHDEGYIISDLILRGNHSGWGIFVYNDADFIDIIDIEIYNFSIGIHVAESNPTNPGSDGENSDLTVKRALIFNNKGQGFMGAGDNLLIEDSIFVNNGYSTAIYNHNIYIGGTGSNEVIRNNKLYQSAMFGGKCSGVSLVAHGDHTNLLIENNIVWEDAGSTIEKCWGIAIDNGHTSGFEQFPGLIIRGNTVVNTGNLGIGCAACSDVVIENNTVVHQITSFGTDAIRVPDRSENSSGDAQSNNVIVRNNTVLYDSPGKGTGITLGDGDGSNYTSTGNDIYYTPGSGMVAGCETYPNTPPDVINVVAGICQNSIPQNLLTTALAKIETIELPETGTSQSGNASGFDYSVYSSANTSGAGAMGWYYLILMAVLLGIKRDLKTLSIPESTAF